MSRCCTVHSAHMLLCMILHRFTIFFFFTSLHNGVCEGGDDITPRPNVNLYILYFITFILMYSQLKSNDKNSYNPKNMLKILTPIKL